AGLARLAQRHELWLVTAREPASLALAETWLARTGLRPHFSGLESAHAVSKAEVAGALGLAALVDDHAPHLLELPASVRGILMTHAHNADYLHAPPMVRAAGWHDHPVFDAL